MFSQIIYYIIGTSLVLILAAFALSSLREIKQRAFRISLFSAIALSAIWLLVPYIFNQSVNYFISIDLFSLITLILFFAPIGKKSDHNFGTVNSRVDERDIMFARSSYKPGTEKYEEYYGKNPEKKKTDDKIRRLPRLLEEGGHYYDPVLSKKVEDMFVVEESRVEEVDGDVAPGRLETDIDSITREIKKQVSELGADEVGICDINPMYFYSNVGLGPEPYGSEIVSTHKFAIMYTLEMDYFKVETAPKIGTTEESARQYLKAQDISVEIARRIRSMGYSARAQVSGSNYQLMLPPLAYDAGLGEIGRNGYLISEKFGPRVRLGCITTELKLKTDKPKSFGAVEFCEICKKCSVNCPSGSISRNGKQTVRGVEKWQLGIEKCYQYWRIIGTDCGLCMKVCPFSHPSNFIHNIFRFGIKNSVIARHLSIIGDDLFYGRKVKYKKMDK